MPQKNFLPVRLLTSELEGYLRVRITGMWFEKPVIADGKLIFDKYADKTRPALAVFERSKDHKKPHVHLAFVPKSRITVQAIRSFVNSLGYKGDKANHYVRQGAPKLMNNHFTYLCKGITEKPFGQLKVVGRSDYFTDAVIDERHRTFWDVNQDIADTVAKKRKRQPVSPSDAILAVVKEKFGEFANPSETQLIDITCEWFANNKKLMNSFYMKSVITHVAYCLNPHSNRIEQLKNELRFKNF